MHRTWIKIAALGALAVVGLYVFASRDRKAEPAPSIAPADLRSEPAEAVSAMRPPLAADATGAASGDNALTEAALMDAANRELHRDPQTALDYIKKADQLYGEHNETRRSLEIQARVGLGNVGHARSLAHRFYREFPSSSEIALIERLTGYHPRPYGPGDP